MIFTLLAVVAGVTIALITGGRPRNISEHQVRLWWLLFPGFGLQLIADRIALGWMGTAALVLGYGCLLAFAAANRSLVGIGVVAVGLAANALVIGVNGGMPVRGSAVVDAHIADADALSRVNYGHRHHLETPHDRLAWLGDIIPVQPLHAVVSFGDLILAFGVADLAGHLFHRRLGRPTRPPSGEPGKYQKGMSRTGTAQKLAYPPPT
jgi:hypothetical protein